MCMLKYACLYKHLFKINFGERVAVGICPKCVHKSNLLGLANTVCNNTADCLLANPKSMLKNYPK